MTRIGIEWAARRFGAVGAVLVVMLGGAGCAAPEPSAPTARPDHAQPPMPEGVNVATPLSSTAPEPDCGDPTASLRPFPQVPPPPTAALTEIQGRGRIVVGLDTGSNLFSFREPATGKIAGFDADIAREVARDLLGDPQRVEFRILSSADVITALKGNTVDLVVKTLTITCERRTEVAFSTVYYLAQQRVLAAKGSGIRGAGDLAGKRVCSVAGTTSVTSVQRVQPGATVITVPNWADCLVLMQQHQADAVSSDDSILAGLASQDPYLEIVGPSLSPEPYGIGLNKADSDLVRLVNGSLARIRRDGTWTRIYDRWLGVLGPAPTPPAPHYQG